MSLSETQQCLYQRTNQDCRIYHSGQFPLLVAKRHIRSFLVMRDRRIDPKLVLPSLIPCKSFLCAFRYVLLVITFRSPESQSGQRRPGGCKGKNGRRPNSETFPILRERDLRSEMTDHRCIIRGWLIRVDYWSSRLARVRAIPVLSDTADLVKRLRSEDTQVNEDERRDRDRSDNQGWCGLSIETDRSNRARFKGHVRPREHVA